MQEEFSEIMNLLSENARFALQKADLFSKKYNNGYMGTEHLLLGILSIDTSTGAKLVREQGATLDEVEKALNKTAVEVAGSDMAMMSLSEAVILTLRMARNFTKEQGINTIGTEHILYALLSQPNSRASLILDSLNVEIDEILDAVEKLVEKQTAEEKLKKEKAKYLRKAPLKFLGRYGKDLTEEARAGKLDAVIGRDSEIERVVTVLSRRTKSNPVLIGEAGVGKTAIVEGLATRIVKNDVPGSLIGKHIYQVDLSSVVAGTKFRGEFEERIKGIIDEATGDDSILLFIDEIHLLCGAGSSEGSMDAANILKPALARN
jgi:ATP-dependent Clp protease ATP-binding subunit ClpC